MMFQPPRLASNCYTDRIPSQTFLSRKTPFLKHDLARRAFLYMASSIYAARLSASLARSTLSLPKMKLSRSSFQP